VRDDRDVADIIVNYFSSLCHALGMVACIQ